MIVPDHPDIVSAIKTGYPRNNQYVSHYCEECGKCLDDEKAYEDCTHDYLCEDCLLFFHSKGGWY